MIFHIDTDFQGCIMKFFDSTCSWSMKQNRSLRSPAPLRILAMNSVMVTRHHLKSPRVLASVLLDRSSVSPNVFVVPVAPAPIVRRRLAIDSFVNSPDVDIDRSFSSSHQIIDETFSVSLITKEIPIVVNKIPTVTICYDRESDGNRRSLRYFIVDGIRYNRIDNTNWYISTVDLSSVRSNVSPVFTKAALKQGLSHASRSVSRISDFKFTTNVDGTIKCSTCNELLKRLQYFRRHVERKHLKIKIFACSLCNRSYCTADDLRLHYRRDHGNNSIVVFSDANKNFRRT